MAESITNELNCPVVQILTDLITWGIISPQLAQEVLEYLYDELGEEAFY